MSNINDYFFAKYLDQFKVKVIDPQTKRVEDAQKIMDDPNHKWDSAEQKKLGMARLGSYKEFLAFYKDFHEQGMILVGQHEQLVNHLSKWYDCWFENISNEGKQETEMMTSQADMLGEIFSEIYKELLPLNLNIKAPKALNLK